MIVLIAVLLFVIAIASCVCAAVLVALYARVRGINVLGLVMDLQRHRAERAGRRPLGIGLSA